MRRALVLLIGLVVFPLVGVWSLMVAYLIGIVPVIVSTLVLALLVVWIILRKKRAPGPEHAEGTDRYSTSGGLL